MSTNAYIGLIQPNRDVKYIYCHWDGYIGHTGEILFNYYNDVNSINELLDLGDLSSIGTSLDNCVAYGRDRGEANCEAIIGSASDMDQEYNYLFNPKENVWMVKCRDTGYDWDYLGDWVDSDEPDIVGSTRLRKSSVTSNKRIEASIMNENNTSKLLRLIDENQGNLLWGDLYYFLNLALDRLDEDTVGDITNRIISEGFFGDPATVNASTSITAAEEDEEVDPLLDRADELKDRVEDDFDYVMAGVERLGRENQLDSAVDILEKLAETFDAAIGIIGGDFGIDENEEDIDEF